MATVTYSVAMPFDRNDEGELVAGEAQERQTASAAESAARRMSETAAGAVAFSRNELLVHSRGGDHACLDAHRRRIDDLSDEERQTNQDGEKRKVVSGSCVP